VSVEELVSVDQRMLNAQGEKGLAVVPLPPSKSTPFDEIVK
jgi:hypothetical protein